MSKVIIFNDLKYSFSSEMFFKWDKNVLMRYNIGKEGERGRWIATPSFSNYDNVQNQWKTIDKNFLDELKAKKETPHNIYLYNISKKMYEEHKKETA